MSDEHHCTGAGGGEHRHDITCREVGEFLLAYLERELEPDVRTEFERHLNYCPPCVHYLDGYRETVELVRRCLRDNAVPSDEQRAKHRPPEGLIQAILAAKRSTER
jgi:anti-sigma factor (TIGR02949 family)